MKIPEELPIIPLRNTVVFPSSVLPLAVGVSRSVKLIEDAMQRGHLIGLVSMKYPQIEEPQPGQVYEVGTVAKVERVLPVGGIKMKVLAAHRAGLTIVILPKRNEKDLDDLSDEVRNIMLFVLVDHIDEALKVVFFPDEEQPEIAAAIEE